MAAGPTKHAIKLAFVAQAFLNTVLRNIIGYPLSTPELNSQ